MILRRFALLLICLSAPTIVLAQKANRRQMVYFDAKNRTLPSPTGAAYAVETEYIDSLRAIEKWYSGPQKVKEVATFSNIKRRLREGETTTFYENGNVKRKSFYQNGRVRETFSYYSDKILRNHFRLEQTR